MRLKTTLLGLAGAGLMASAPAQAVDLVGAYQDALDPAAHPAVIESSMGLLRRSIGAP